MHMTPADFLPQAHSWGAGDAWSPEEGHWGRAAGACRQSSPRKVRVICLDDCPSCQGSWWGQSCSRCWGSLCSPGRGRVDAGISVLPTFMWDGQQFTCSVVPRAAFSFALHCCVVQRTDGKSRRAWAITSSIAHEWTL